MCIIYACIFIKCGYYLAYFTVYSDVAQTPLELNLIMMQAETLQDVFISNWNKLKAKCSDHHQRIQAKIDELNVAIQIKEENADGVKQQNNFDKLKKYHETIWTVMKEDMKLFETEMLKRFMNEKMPGSMLDLCSDEFSHYISI